MAKSYEHLSYAERVLIQAQLTLGLKPTAIALGRGRCPSTILQEIRRNGWLGDLPGRAAGGMEPRAVWSGRGRSSRPGVAPFAPGRAQDATGQPALARSMKKYRRNQAIPNMTLIDQRPIEVAMRLVPGHWEGDIVVNKGNRSQVGTLVQRTALFVALVKLDNAKAVTAPEGFASILNRFENQMRRSITYDQGIEMAHHQT